MPMSPFRIETAKAMEKSAREIPAAYFITEVDVTNVLEAINEKRRPFFEEHKARLTLSSFVILAIARAVERYPHLNARYCGDKIHLHEDLHLGIAVSVKETVIVPVIHNCQELTLVQIAKKLNLLVEKARKGKLTNEEVTGGSLTMTNFGMAKMQIGIPIIRPGEIAIIGIGMVEKKVVVMHDNEVAIRSMMHLSMAFDHRVIDGMYAAAFLNHIKQELSKN